MLHSYTELYKEKDLIYQTDYEAINVVLHKIDWEKELEPKSVDNQWSYFKETIKRIIEDHIPSKTVTIKLGKRRGALCDAKTLEKIREKHHLRRKSIETKDPLV